MSPPYPLDFLVFEFLNFPLLLPTILAVVVGHYHRPMQRSDCFVSEGDGSVSQNDVSSGQTTLWIWLCRLSPHREPERSTLDNRYLPKSVIVSRRG